MLPSVDKPNILIDALPETVEVNGMAFSIRTDFRIGIMFELMVFDQNLSDDEKVENALELYFIGQPPEDALAAVDAILWFFSCGNVDKYSECDVDKSAEGAAERKARDRAYDYEVDAGRIYSAFAEQYGIDLSTASLHWWKFQALFASLHNCAFCEIAGYRTVDLSAINDKKERARLARLKAKYALPSILSNEERIALAGNAFSGGSGW